MEDAVSSGKDTREYLFDNYKVLLIILVVISHFIEPNYEQNPFLYELKWAIVAFHMPAFIFISGYFSKRIPSLRKLISSLVIPYFVYEILYYLLYTYLLDKETGLYLTRPKFSLWYLMALFAWRAAAPLVIRIPGAFVLSLAAGLLVGVTNLDNYLSIPRILFFFPFFLAGMKFDSSIVMRLRSRRETAYGAAGILGLFIVFLLTDTWHDRLSPWIFYGRYSYHEMDLGNWEGIQIRIFCYAISFLLVYLLMLVLPDTQKPYSYLGQRTMSIYIFHGFAYSCLKYRSDILKSVESNLESLLLILFCLFLVWLFSRKPFVYITNKIAHLI